LSEFSDRGIYYLNMLCHLLMFRRMNQDWTKCGQISLFVSVTRKSSDSSY